MLEIKDLCASLADEEKQILKGVNLTVEAGKVHAIMGPNGSGKSTLSYVLAGKDGYEVTAGSAVLDDEDILEMETEDRAAAGHRHATHGVHVAPVLLYTGHATRALLGP